MPRTAVALLLSLLLGACGDEHRPVEVTPAQHDFGRVMQGQMPEFAFTLTNHSDRTIGFKAVPNCSCFAAAHGLRPLDPGQSQQFQVLFDTTAKPPGPVQGKWITIHTDHPDVPGIVVPLEGEIFRAYDVTPPSFNLGRIDGRPANYMPRTIRLRPAAGYTVGLRKQVANPPIFDLDVAAVASGGFDVQVSIRRDIRLPIGPLRAQVRLDLALTPPGSDKAMHQSATVNLQGFWSLPP